MKIFVRIILEVVLGMAFSVLISFVLISLGYFIVNSKDLVNYDVNIFGLEIFEILDGGKVGHPLTNNMKYLGMICSVLFVILGEIGIKFKNKR